MRCVLVAVIAAACIPAHADEILAGKYAGEYRLPGLYNRELPQLSLQISSAEGGKLSGEARIFGPVCPGTYAVAGTYSGNRLSLHSTGVEGVRRPGCKELTIGAIVENGELIGHLVEPGGGTVRLRLKK